MSNPSDNKPSAPAPGVRKGPGLLLTSVGALVVAGIVAAVNWGVSATNGRLDFTEFKTHSLTEGTRSIVERVDTEVTLRLFVSENEILPPQFVPAVEETMNWLARYKELKPDLIKVEKKVVTPTSDEEEQAVTSGIQGNRGMFFGMTITCLDKTAIINWVPELLSIAGSEDDRIEYYLSRSVSEVTRRDRKRIGLMTPLKLAGNQMPFGGNQSPPWAFYSDLKSQYEVKTIDMGVKAIQTTSQDAKEGVDVLVLVHPAGISEESLYAVDQYLLDGGRIVAFVDGYSYMASQSGGQQPGMPPGMSPGAVDTGSSLGKLLTTWGYSFDSTKIVADKGASTPMGRDFNTPILLTLGKEQITKTENVVKDITNLWFIFSGGFAGSPATGLNETRYVSTTAGHSLVGTEYATINPQTPEGQQKFEELERKFSPEKNPRLLAMRLDGNFKTSFPEGKPAPAPEKPEGGPPGGGFPGGFPGGGPQGAQGAEGAPAPAATPPAATPPAAPAAAANPAPAAGTPAPVSATTPPISIDPVPAPSTPAAPAVGTPTPAPGTPAPGDATPPLPLTPPPIQDPAANLLPPPAGVNPPSAAPGTASAGTAPTTTEQLKESKKPGTVYLVADSDMLCDLLTRNMGETGNVAMALNMVDEAAGDADLMKVRSRGAAIRPFSTLNKIKEQAETKIRSELQKLEDERTKLQEKISTAKTNKERNQALYTGLMQDQKSQIEIGQKKYQLVKKAKKEIDEQVNSIKWKNVLIPPIVVALAGIVVFITRRFNTAAH